MSGQNENETSYSSSNMIRTAVIDFFAGCVGGTTSVYVGQPLDTVKVKLQTFPKLYKNAAECFFKTLKNEGVYRGLYAGTIPSVAAQVSENSILFLAYGMCQRVIANLSGHGKVSDLSVLQNASAGSCAAFFSSFALCPTELVKCKLQSMHEMSLSSPYCNEKLPRIGPWQITKDIIRVDGVKGLYKGLVPTIAREVPGYFFFFGGHALTSYLLTPFGSPHHNLGAIGEILCGGMAGVSLWVVVFPADVVKSHAQVYSKSCDKLSIIETCRKIKSEYGIIGFYRGLGPTLLRTFPATGALFLAVENTKRFLNANAPISTWESCYG